MATKRGGGPKRKLTPEAHTAIVRAVGDGLPYRFAAAAAGCSESALMKWMRAGRTGRSPDCVQLFHDIKDAQAKAVAKRLKELTTAGKSQWQAHAWWLERMFPGQFAVNRLEVRELQKQLKELMGRVAKLAPPESPHADPRATPPA